MKNDKLDKTAFAILNHIQESKAALAMAHSKLRADSETPRGVVYQSWGYLGFKKLEIAAGESPKSPCGTQTEDIWK